LPPQLLSYNCHVAPVPKEPPLTVIVADVPEQTDDGKTVSDVGAVEMVLIFTVSLTQEVVLQVPEACTKYVVVAEGVTVNIPVTLLEMRLPPQLLSYNCHEAPVPKEPPFTVRVEGDPEHTEDGELERELGAEETELTVIVLLTQVVVLQVPEACT